jgi:uncharacterized membrane protein YgcG
LAQRELHWDALTVTAHLNADGSLTVAEEQAIVFNGDWNGGERVFSVRPRQTLSVGGMARWTGGGWQPMREDGGLGSVDDYALNGTTLRWRSRLPSDPPFDRTSIRYLLRYTLGGILRRDGDRLTLDHDFAFPDRSGSIDRFELNLTLDPVWQPMTEVGGRYSAALAPGKSFVLTIPLRYVGSGTPTVLDESRPPAVRNAVLAIVGLTLLSIVWLVASEHRKGRFVPVRTDGIDESWLREHILKYPAEVVSAAWDDRIGGSEVVTVLARMTGEGKLESSADYSGMTLRLLVERDTLTGYERRLVDALFFDGRTTTSSAEVKRHYRDTGLNLVEIIRPDLAAAVKTTFPFASARPYHRVVTVLLSLAGVGLGIAAWFNGELPAPLVFLLPVASLILALVVSVGGRRFRTHMERGLRSLLLALIPPVFMAGAVALFIWSVVGSGRIELAPLPLASLVALTLATVIGSVNSLRSRQRRDGIAFRKQLTAGRMYFMSQLAMPRPALRDAWYPWLLAFELGKKMDQWSVGHAGAVDSGSGTFGTGASSSSTSGSSSPSWTGFSGGRSGGAGASGEWAAAAGGLAAGVAAPSSSGSSSSSGGSSGGGSSGGGGGGGW